MSWFKRRGEHAGWLALQLHDDHVDLVHAGPGAGGRPAVTFFDSFRPEGSAASTLARLRRKLGLGRYRRTTLLPSAHYQLREVDAPGVPDAEAKAAVRWRVEEMIDYPLASATVEVLRIPSDPAARAEPAGFCAVAARTEDVAACAAPYAEARLPLNAVDIPELAQRNVAALFEPEGLGVAMLAFHPEGGLLTFTCKGEYYASRRIDIPAAKLAEGDAQACAAHLARIALEVQRSLDHFERQYRYMPVAKLIVAPLVKDIGLTEFLNSRIDRAVEAVDLATVLDFSAVPQLGEPRLQAHYFQLIGAALRGAQGAPT